MNSLNTVSYTHLDVYKRQLVDLFKYLSIPIDNEVLETYINNEVGDNKLTDKAARYKVLQSIVTVSYTHLLLIGI